MALSGYSRRVVRSFGCHLFVSFVILLNSAKQIVERAHEPLEEWTEQNGGREGAQISSLLGLSYLTTAKEMAICIMI